MEEAPISARGGELPASATEIDPNPTKLQSAFNTIPENQEDDDKEE